MYIQLGAGATSTLHLYSNNTETMTLKSTYVGIGTNNPLSALHVMGNKATSPSVKGIHMGEGGANDFSIEICDEINDRINYCRHVIRIGFRRFQKVHKTFLRSMTKLPVELH